MKEGDILVAQWGYEANNVNYFKVLKRTKRFVEIAELTVDTKPGDTGIYMGVFAIPGSKWKHYSLWADRESWNMSEREDGKPIKFRRMVKPYRDGSEYIELSNYAWAFVWNGEPQVDYNHH